MLSIMRQFPVAGVWHPALESLNRPTQAGQQRPLICKVRRGLSCALTPLRGTSLASAIGEALASLARLGQTLADVTAVVSLSLMLKSAQSM
jgi:hypothetical protein